MSKHACIDCGTCNSGYYHFADGIRCWWCSRGKEGLLCAFCGDRTHNLATHSTDEGDSVCEDCAKGYAVQMHFSQEDEIEAWHEGKASPEFTAKVERYWKWVQED